MGERGLTWDSEYMLPYETMWGRIEKACYINGLSMNMFKNYIIENYEKNTGMAFDVARIEKGIDHSPFDNSVFWKKYIYHPKLKFCPVCMTYGYHSIFHQFTFMDTCFIHSCKLVEAEDISFSPFYKKIKAGKHYSYLQKKPRIVDIMDSREYLLKDIHQKTTFLKQFRYIHPISLLPRNGDYIKNKNSEMVLRTLINDSDDESLILEIPFKELIEKSKSDCDRLVSRELLLANHWLFKNDYNFSTRENNIRLLCHLSFIYIRQLYFNMVFRKDEHIFECVKNLVFGKVDVPLSYKEYLLDYLSFFVLFDTKDPDFIEKVNCKEWTYDPQKLQCPFGIKLYGLETIAATSRKSDYFYIIRGLVNRTFNLIKEQLREQVVITGAQKPRIEYDYKIKPAEYILAEGYDTCYLYECFAD